MSACKPSPQEIIGGLYLEGPMKGTQVRMLMNPTVLLGWHKFMDARSAPQNSIYHGIREHRISVYPKTEFLTDEAFNRMTTHELEKHLRWVGVPSVATVIKDDYAHGVKISWNVILVDPVQYESMFDEDFFEPADFGDADWHQDFRELTSNDLFPTTATGNMDPYGNPIGAHYTVKRQRITSGA